jgi:DNA-directed RNA polymerase subunit RPC12/RpoP
MVRAAKILIEHQCPQCGAPATLEETDRLFSCTYCRVKSFLTHKNFFHYLIPHAPKGKEEAVYLPYWRLKGILFWSMRAGIRHRIVDASCQAVSSTHFPVSLGLRSQTMKLRFVPPQADGRFLKPDIAAEKMKSAVQGSFLTGLADPVFEHALIGETPSIIYSPFYIRSRVYDAVLDRPVSDVLPEDFTIESPTDPHPDMEIRFIPTLCPKCGWDMEGERDSLVLHCRNCRILYQAGNGRFKPIRVAHLPESEKGCLFLPFYQIEADTSGVLLRSFADLVTAANLPKVIRKEWENRSFHFWSPAFKIRPEDFLRFARTLTLSQPQSDLVPGVPNKILHPVTLSIAEASEGLIINLASFIKPPEVMLPKLKEIAIKPRRALLVYIPFQETGADLSHPDFQLRVNKHLLKYAKHL